MDTLLQYTPLGSYRSLFTFAILLAVWAGMGMIDREKAKNLTYKLGYLLSQKCQMIPYWDKYAEPIIIRQLALLFVTGHAFVEGMISDNKDKEEAEKEMEKMEDLVKDVLDDEPEEADVDGVLEEEVVQEIVEEINGE